MLRRYRYKAIRLFEMTVGLHVGNLLILEPKERLSYVKESSTRHFTSFIWVWAPPGFLLRATVG